MSEVVLDVRGLARRYGEAAVFQGVDLQVSRGEFVAILGESGVGKSTLLNCIAGLDRPDAGEVRVLGFDITHADEAQQAHWRRRHLGFVFQAFHVLPHLTVAQNVALPLMLLGEPDDGRVEQALRSVGLAGLGSRLPQQLSGGQVQRVAIARALINRPPILLADEPTGALDTRTGDEIMALFRRLQAEGHTIVLITHEQHIADFADRILVMRDGELHEQEVAA